MAGGSDKYVSGYVGLVEHGSTERPQWSESKSITKQGGAYSNVQQQTSKVNYEDKVSGSYERYTAKEKVSTGQPFGRAGFKDEAQRSSTVKIGDKSGYTEYYTEEKVSRVNYGNKSYNSGNTGRGKNKY